jgi:hypothetical protein
MDPLAFRRKNGFVTGDETICAQPLTDNKVKKNMP